MLRSSHIAVSGLFMVFLISTAEARYHWYYWHHQSFGQHRADNTVDIVQRGRDPRFSETRSALGPVMAQLTGICIHEVGWLKTAPVEAIERTITIAGESTAIQNIRRVANETATTLAAKCPSDIEPAPSGRLDALTRSLDAVEAALSTMQPVFQGLYSSFSDEQKGALVARSSATSSDNSGGVGTSGLSTRSRASASVGREMTQVADWRTCEQLGAELRDWPIARVEQIVQVGARQRAAFYELAASFQHAADGLADACPSESAATPLGQMAQLRRTVDAVRQSITIIRPAVERFYQLLDTGQKKRFSDTM